MILTGAQTLPGGVAVVVAPSAVLAGEVAVRVMSLAVAGAASPADLAGVVAVDVTSLFWIREAPVGGQGA